MDGGAAAGKVTRARSRGMCLAYLRGWDGEEHDGHAATNGGVAVAHLRPGGRTWYDAYGNWRASKTCKLVSCSISIHRRRERGVASVRNLCGRAGIRAHATGR